ncbi:unnamed protein product [Lepeophtheirus salmonis]|uniref:(salmon louse) hypothetical protein n=1 Tax=Lepeophtheirus salmonis TaxID=72036 RepID=A0A7R8CQW9_LEPSM|nr:unnamed protein product [Lepeophtheirus salmonis]CAF2897242.1 unnamed protein product [Lepeophtheirus salmonis]
MGTKGLISYSEYLFLLTILLKSQSGFKLAFAMLDQDGNKRIDKEEFKIMENVFSSVNKKETINSEKIEDNIFSSHEDVSTLLETYFFGKSGDRELRLDDFNLFMDNIQTEVLQREFFEYSKGAECLNKRSIKKTLERFCLRLQNLKVQGITFKEFREFSKFLNQMDDFQIAMRMYTLADKAITEDEFTRTVYICTGQVISDYITKIIFLLFDTDGDGLLSYKEFIAMMQDRVHRRLKRSSKNERNWVKSWPSMKIGKKFMSLVPKSHQEPDIPKFTTENINTLNRVFPTSHFDTGMELLIHEWADMSIGSKSKRATIGYVRDLCLKGGFIRAADYLNHFVLGGERIFGCDDSILNSVEEVCYEEDEGNQEDLIRWDNLISEDMSSDSSSLFEINSTQSVHLSNSGPFIPVNDLKVHSFPLKYILKITKDFGRLDPSFKIGSGGYSEVFKGLTGQMRCGGREKVKKNTERKEYQFNNEIETIPNLFHPNIIKILGYCNESVDHLCLIYPFMENGSLECRLELNPPLTWPEKLNISQGIISGIVFLHEGAQKELIHRDIKTANVLIDINLRPKIIDFGFFFGVILIELITGLKAFDENREDRDLATHIQEHASYLDLIDKKSPPWDRRRIENCVEKEICVSVLMETKEEGKRLSPGDPSSYSRPDEVKVLETFLELDVNFEDHVLEGSATLTVEKVLASASTLILDSRNLDISLK